MDYLLLVHLVHLVVHLDQVEFDDATDMERLRRRIGGSCRHSATSQTGLLLTIDAFLGWLVACVCAHGETRVGVITSAEQVCLRISGKCGQI